MEKEPATLCRNCDLPITFGPHPRNKIRLAPFNMDGSLHFPTCAKTVNARSAAVPDEGEDQDEPENPALDRKRFCFICDLPLKAGCQDALRYMTCENNHVWLRVDNLTHGSHAQ